MGRVNPVPNFKDHSKIRRDASKIWYGVKVEKPTKEQLDKLGVDKWGKWECDVKKFDWYYDDNETFYVLEGKVKVSTDDGEQVEFGKGDLVTFPQGVKCTWDVKEKISKVYKFGGV